MAEEKKIFTNDKELIDFYCSKPHPKTFDLAILLLILVTSVVGAIIGMELIVRFGLSTNSSIIGALVAVLIGMIPLKATQKFRNIHVQNLVETSISCATFGAGNVLMVCVAVIWVFNRPDLCMGILVGGVIAFLVDITMMYWLFDTPLFSASEAWPIGIATAETILAAGEKGKKALIMTGGIFTGILGTWFGLPMDILGVCGLGNIFALTAFCIALVCNGYWAKWFGYALGDFYVPQGFMVGAGLIGLVQATLLIIRKYKEKQTNDKETKTAEVTAVVAEVPETKEDNYICTRSVNDMSRSLVTGVVLYIIGAIIMAMIGGIYSEMSVGLLIWWIIYAMIAAIISEILVGISAMHSGYFPAMATVVIFLVLAMFMGFPAHALAYLAGYAACTGPAFADMGYDLKTGWILRGKLRSGVKYELEGRRQQYLAEIMGGIVAIICVFLFYKVYFTAGRIPPVASVYKATIDAGVDARVLKLLLIWACCGGLLQLVSGLKRQLGILFAAGLLIKLPIAGVAGLIFLAIRWGIQKKYGTEGTQVLNVFSAGLIAGSALFSFSKNTFKLIVPK